MNQITHASGGIVLSPGNARNLTDRIKVAVEGTWLLIQEAYTTRAWSALGYGSWDEYCTREFDTARLRLPREERQEVVASMRENGLSVRAISSATGLGYGTVQREITEPSGDPAGSPEDAIPVTGTDGKTYTPRPPQPSKPRTDIPRTVNSALVQIDTARRTLEALTRSQLAHQNEEARRAWTANLSESVEALGEFLKHLSQEG